MENRKYGFTYTRWCLSLMILCLSSTALAQLEPCGLLYEADGQPGYTVGDFAVPASEWRSLGSYPAVPDYNDDGVVNILDLTHQANCVQPLSRGLVGHYYGYNTGDPEQTMSFPDLDSPGFEPTAIRTTDRLEEFQGWRGFLNSQMLDLFAVRFTGYLWVPETANYTLEITGRQGMRVSLDGSQILAFDGSPRNDSTTLSLDWGLHPIQVDFYAEENASITLTWSSDGTVIGGTNSIIGPDYLFHDPATVPEHSVADMSVVFDPPSGTRITTSTPDISAWVLSPDGDVSLDMEGARVLRDGKMEHTFSVSAGLNAIPYTATDSEGRTVSGTYHLYWDAVPAMQAGLNAHIYTDEWYRGVVPATQDAQPIRHEIVAGTQFELDGNERLYVEGRYVPGHTVVEVVGVIRVLNPGEYNFRIDDGRGALYINGEQLAAIENDYAGQWYSNSDVTLDVGRHHFRMRVGRAWESPAMRVFWTPPGGSEVQIPDTQFLYNSAETILPPDYSDSQATAGRSRVNQAAEYLFDPADPFADTSGNGYDLPFEPAAFVHGTGGISWQTPAGTSSIELGSQLLDRLKAGEPISLEVDFIPNTELDYHKRSLVSIGAPWTPILEIYTRNDDLYFELTNPNGFAQAATANNVIANGQRIHVVGTYNGTSLSLWVNGAQVASQGYSPDLSLHPAQAAFNVGQAWFRRNYPDTWGYQMHGTFLAVAAYNERLGPGAVGDNYAANPTINPNPGAVAYGAQPAFPPPGTTQSQLDEAFHVLNRLSYGPSPASIADILDVGVDAWIDEQLDPNSIDDSALEAELASGIFLPHHYVRDLQGQTVYRMTRSQRQLLEIMTQFWENHFNTQVDKTSDLEEEIAENERFRALAFGSFVDLLTASAMNMPMTVYLDSDSNVVGAANENYAREILELHTYGVNNGYTQADIEEAARCFTGWTVQNGRFAFNPGLHDYGPKSLLGLNIPAGGGLSDGLTVIAHIAASPNTAEFISWKLCQLFVDDDPPADVQSAVATTFSSSGGDIEATLRTLFAHARFRTDLSYRGNKIKNPLEFATGLMRATEVPLSSNAPAVYLSAMGMDLFNYPDPTGFDEAGVSWMDTNSLLARWNMVNDMTVNRLNSTTPVINIWALSQRYGWTTYDEILDFFENITTHGTEPAGTRAITESWLTADNPGGFVIDDDTLDNRIRQTLGMYLRMPEFNKQ